MRAEREETSMLYNDECFRSFSGALAQELQNPQYTDLLCAVRRGKSRVKAINNISGLRSWAYKYKFENVPYHKWKYFANLFKFLQKFSHSPKREREHTQTLFSWTITCRTRSFLMSIGKISSEIVNVKIIRSHSTSPPLVENWKGKLSLGKREFSRRGVEEKYDFPENLSTINVYLMSRHREERIVEVRVDFLSRSSRECKEWKLKTEYQQLQHRENNSSELSFFLFLFWWYFQDVQFTVNIFSSLLIYARKWNLICLSQTHTRRIC